MSKKGSKGSKTEVSLYEVADIVLGKLRGYPPWPGRVADPASIPSEVLKERPPGKKGVVYCIQFFPAGDFSWISSKDISKLKPNEIETYIADHPEVKRSADLLEGYKIARDPREWSQNMAEKAAAAKAAESAEDEEAESDGDEEDELADEGEQLVSSKKKKAGNAPAATKKRKRISEPTAKTKATPKTKGTGKGRKSKAAIESEDDEDDTQEAQVASKGSAPIASPPPAKKAKTAPFGKEENPEDAELAKDPEATKVREWRHKLQKVFLSSKVQAPKQEDMPDMNDLFTQIETYDKINIAYLSFSKIGKVMRHITALSDDKVPMDSQFKFRDRAKVLVERWQHILNASRVDSKESSKPPAKESKNTAANGVDSKNSPGETSQSPSANNGANENVNGIADAINNSIATGTAEIDDGALAKVNGNGHFNEGKVMLIFLYWVCIIFSFFLWIWFDRLQS
ncbi:hypothetical protein F5890DRAFT_1420968 [Lentinula detonsa]|uniref:PWWP domain-containing protein n=1 Tax=Lentinula detonsa TaxID=2804962 RepID=A0AA38PR09_9AGAR|nr:hypothetical protein F5890DRAFT_1420968 [Lentinula detonsa]